MMPRDALMHPRQRQGRTNEDESPHPAAPRLDVFSVVGKPLTTSLDAGVPLRDVQEAASHADPRTTMRYDNSRVLHQMREKPQVTKSRWHRNSVSGLRVAAV